MEKQKKFLALLLAVAMVFTSISIPFDSAKAASTEQKNSKKTDISIVKVDVDSKYYDGGTNIIEKVNVTFDKVNLTEKDYIVESAEFTDPNPGTNKDVVVTVRLYGSTERKYNLINGENQIFKTTASIKKPNSSVVKDIGIFVDSNSSEKGKINISQNLCEDAIVGDMPELKENTALAKKLEFNKNTNEISYEINGKSESGSERILIPVKSKMYNDYFIALYIHKGMANGRIEIVNTDIMTYNGQPVSVRAVTDADEEMAEGKNEILFKHVYNAWEEEKPEDRKIKTINWYDQNNCLLESAPKDAGWYTAEIICSNDKGLYVSPGFAPFHIEKAPLKVVSGELHPAKYDGDKIYFDSSLVKSLKFDNLMPGDDLTGKYVVNSIEFEDSNIGKNKNTTIYLNLKDDPIANNYELTNEKFNIGNVGEITFGEHIFDYEIDVNPNINPKGVAYMNSNVIVSDITDKNIEIDNENFFEKRPTFDNKKKVLNYTVAKNATGSCTVKITTLKDNIMHGQIIKFNACNKIEQEPIKIKKTSFESTEYFVTLEAEGGSTDGDLIVFIVPGGTKYAGEFGISDGISVQPGPGKVNVVVLKEGNDKYLPVVSDVTTLTFKSDIPEKVKNIKVKTDYGLAKVNFDKSENADSYNIAYRYKYKGKYSSWKYTNTKTNSVIIKNLYKNVPYDIRVNAINNHGGSGYVSAGRVYYTNRLGSKSVSMPKPIIYKTTTYKSGANVYISPIKYISKAEKVAYQFAYKAKGTSKWVKSKYTYNNAKAIKGLKSGKIYTFAVRYAYKSAVDGKTYVYSDYAYKNIKVK